ncbi:Glutamine-binding periplasmic protein precursor [Symmachiella macrocystis]|uniref:Glutamine-binding periplasmic protein n=1 Tax=Symmachiella macrocystis TaxID=2527985 RepID=A0A5C6BDG3_9PLAN|nr:transporter substrate-binding domain-containing protein [Symmachiella macrocystis]TWU09316.1 Glutamine-binding periplasmic protein precursor [Symmachiella macrocystis]
MIDGKRQFRIQLWAFVSMWLLSSTITFAQPDEKRVLRIGTKEAAPFSILNEDGTWSGISIELWRGVANEMGLRYEFENLPLDEILAGVESGELDAGVAAITITHEREQLLDFSHSYFNSGLGIAVAQRQTTNWSAVVKRIFSTVFLKIVFTIFLVLMAMGTLVYLFERRRNRADFGGSVFRGLSSGIWWAAVTMTTVGYGDKVPKSPGGRAVAVLWMYTAIIIISIFTASVTSILTLSQLESNVRGPRDLHNVRLATVADSTSAAYLRRQGIAFKSFPAVDQCLAGLERNQFGAVVYDAPILRYMVHNEHPGLIQVLPATFEKQDYAIAIPPESPFRESLNQAILQVITTPQWDETLRRYLGD